MRTDRDVQVRICIEHAFAALKGHFQSLRELRTHVQKTQDIKYAVHWVQRCLILHNMVIRFEEALGTSSTMPWAQQECNNLDKGGENIVVHVPVGSPGQLFRADLMGKLFEALGEQYIVNNGQE